MTAQTVALIVIALLVAIAAPGAPLEDPPDRFEAPSPVEVVGEVDFADLYVLGYYMQDSARTGRRSLETNSPVIDGVSPWSWGLTKEGDLRPVYFTEKDLADLLT